MTTLWTDEKVSTVLVDDEPKITDSLSPTPSKSVNDSNIEEDSPAPLSTVLPLNPMALHVSPETLDTELEDSSNNSIFEYHEKNISDNINPENIQLKNNIPEPDTELNASINPVSENETAQSYIKSSKIPSTVWVLGFMMFLMNCSYLMTFSFSGLYLRSLGVANVGVGFLEGLAEATSFVMKFLSGVISDALKRRKPVIFIGYALSVISRPLMAIASFFGLFFFAKMMERIGNGIQGTPRDAIVADITPPKRIGAAYGLKRSLATLGSIVGAIVGFIVMWAADDNMNTVFWWACVPSFIAFVLLIFFVKEPKRMGHSAVSSEVPLPATKRRHRISFSNLRLLGSSFWLLMGINAIFMLSRVGEQMIVLHANGNYALENRYAPVIFMVYNAGYCLTSYPVGLIADRMNRYLFLAIGIILMVLAGIILATAVNVWVLFIGILFWGFQCGITLNIFSSLIAETVPENLRGTGFGCYYIINAVSIVMAETMAGKIADIFGYHSSFIVSAIIGLMSLIALVVVMATRSSNRKLHIS